MPYFQCRTLKQELKAAGGKLPPARARFIARGAPARQAPAMKHATQGAEMNATPKQLDSRSSNGITVVLYWHPHTNGVSVLVNDEPADETFELQVDPADALDAFNHPYAYAAYRGAPELLLAA